MSDAPRYEIDAQAFRADPYPDLARMRAEAPIAHVPQLGATLITRRDDIFRQEKRVEVFSSDQPEGLMTVLMGQNLMRKDGAEHAAERKAIFPTVSPKTVRDVWTAAFRARTAEVLDRIAPLAACDLVADYALPVSGEALKAITGLTNMTYREMDRVSQGMIDGCANYSGDREVEANCHDCTASIDRHIDERMPALRDAPDVSLLSVQMQAGLSEAQHPRKRETGDFRRPERAARCHRGCRLGACCAIPINWRWCRRVRRRGCRRSRNTRAGSAPSGCRRGGWRGAIR